MKKSDFLSQLHTAVVAATEESLAGTFWSASDCPWIERWFEYYGSQSGAQVERALRRYAPRARQATNARDYFPLVADRVKQGIAQWSATGEVEGLPQEMLTETPPETPGAAEGGESALGAAATGVLSTAAAMFFKQETGGRAELHDPARIQAELGNGHPLDGAARSRMERAFSADFSAVRVHTDPNAAELSDDLNARAFTVGQHVAFGPSEYMPGTPVGDALLAHELAHVVQQGDSTNAATMQKGEVDADALEEQADLAAIEAVASLWGPNTPGRTGGLRGLATGLRLQRCGKSPSKSTVWNAPTGTSKTAIPETVSPFGKIDVDHGLTANPSVGNTSYGEYSITIEMTPNERTNNADEIAFMQISRQGMRGGGWAKAATDEYMTADKARRTEQTTGWRVDRASYATDKTPFYGMTKSGAGITNKGYAHVGKFGGTTVEMEDTPGVGEFDHMQFMACAICEKPVAAAPQEKDRSYGCISWGYQYDRAAPNVADRWKEETPSFSIQEPFGAQTGRAEGMERAVAQWNTNIATAGSGIDKAPTPYSIGATVNNTVAGGQVTLRRIATTGPNTGKMELTTDTLAAGATMMVLQKKVNRADHDGTLKDMTEVMHNNAPAWLLFRDLTFTH